MDYQKAVTASGHPLVSEASSIILEAGGNAFDAIVAAGFASTVVEPVLNTLGGGGLLVGYDQRRGQTLYVDFFVDTPGLGGAGREAKDFFPVGVDFADTVQHFNIGAAAAAVPGTLKGLLHCHARLGRMPLKEVLEPACSYALGHRVVAGQARFFSLTRPILRYSAAGLAIYEPDGRFVQTGDRLVNSELATFLRQIGEEGGESFYRGEIAAKIDAQMAETGGLLTAEDLAAYQVRERPAVEAGYAGGRFVTAAEPSMGGALIALSLGLQEMAGGKDGLPEYGSGAYLCRSTAIMQEVERLRAAGVVSAQSVAAYLNRGEMIASSLDNIRLFSRGTTHISVADREGNCAGMTCSNGEGCGVFAPGTGVMLNNMMGEDDLHPDGFHSSPPGQRVYSMMSPSMYIKDGVPRLVLGSGGSKRIRTAIAQVLSLVVEYALPLSEAVEAARLYLDEQTLQLEPGFTGDAVSELREKSGMDINEWGAKDVYFGGVHAVIPGMEGAGDSRRGGAVRVVG